MINRFARAIFVLITIGALLVGGASILATRAVAEPVDAADTEISEFVVEEGSTVTEIANLLQDEGFISQPLVFRYLAREQQADSMKAGAYRLRKNMTMSEIIATLSADREGEGGEEVEFTIIPGQRLEEIADVMVEAGLAPDAAAFLEVARDVEPFKERHPRLSSIPDDQTLEGYLFPNTYRVFADSSIPQVIDRVITDGFDANYAEIEGDVQAKTADGETPTTHEIVTMASIIQREAFVVEDMAHIGYIFWRRLDPETPEVNGRLQSDPTLQYVVGTSENWWPNINETLTTDQINANESPYNTRRTAGLPPGPISAPTLDALRAAAQPNPNRPGESVGADDLYFISPCNTNDVRYAETFAEFEPLVAEYLACAAN